MHYHCKSWPQGNVDRPNVLWTQLIKILVWMQIAVISTQAEFLVLETPIKRALTHMLPLAFLWAASILMTSREFHLVWMSEATLSVTHLLPARVSDLSRKELSVPVIVPNQWLLDKNQRRTEEVESYELVNLQINGCSMKSMRGILQSRVQVFFYVVSPKGSQGKPRTKMLPLNVKPMSWRPEEYLIWADFSVRCSLQPSSLVPPATRRQ